MYSPSSMALCRHFCYRKAVNSLLFRTCMSSTWQTHTTELSTFSSHSNHSKDSKYNFSEVFKKIATGSGLLLSFGVVYSLFRKNETVYCKQKPISPLTYEPGSVVDNLPTFTAEEVRKRNAPETGIWVTYKNGVYDVTRFIKWHPGGEKILLAAGGSLEPFFALFAVHNTKEVMEMMESMRIGNIFDTKLPRIPDAYQDDPERHAALKVKSEKPFNAEPPSSLLVDSFVTPNSLFFVRNHLPVPIVDEAGVSKYELEGAAGNVIKSITYEEIKALPKETVVVTIQCAGNRRSEMSQTKEVKGLSWEAASISTASWTGPRLSDVLHAMGFTNEELKGKHLQFEGLDKDPTGASYGASIPAEIAFNPTYPIIVAYEMNDEPLSRDHGYPLRVVIPGVVGARNVKWLKRIIVSDEESKSHWQRKDYKTFNPSVDFNTCDFDQSQAIQETPVQSAICEPTPGSSVASDDDSLRVKGYAFSGGGKGIIRVDVSADGGKTWINAELNNNGQSLYKAWAWTLWEADVPIPKDHHGKVELVCKAVDSSHNVQPETSSGIWNPRGLLNNAWHRVTVNVKS